MPAPAPFFKGNTSTLIEQPESGKYVLADRVTQTKIYRGTYALCVASAVGKGTLGTGALAGWKVDSCNIDREPRGVGKLTINWVAGAEASSQPLPPDEIGLDPIEINPPLEKNPFYSSLTDAQIAAVVKAVESSHLSEPISTPGALNALQLNLLAKRRKGISNFYLAGIKYSWTRHFWTISGTIELGGFIDTPAGPLTGILPGALAALRQADSLVFTGEYFKYTQAWLLAPLGHWDNDLY